MNVISLLTPKASVAYLYSDLTIRHSLDKFRRNGYTAVPVIDRQGQYKGCVGEGDFLWYLVGQDSALLRDRLKDRLSKIVRPDFNPAVRIDVTLEELLERSLQQSFIPVTDDRGVFIGIVTRQNIIRNLTVLKAQAPAI